MMNTNRAREHKEGLPSFLIVGAMKSGTVSLHHILRQHKDVFMPAQEIFFFDIDDIEQHPDFFVMTSSGWSFHDYQQNFEAYLSWYRSFFKDARKDQLVGERSTTYMASQKAPYRIAQLLPNIMLVFMLRDPVSRTYSHYWHLVGTGRAIYDFEKTLQQLPGTLLQRGHYKRHIDRFKDLFPEKNLKFIIFEAFIKDVQAAINETCEFLGFADSIDVREITIRKHSTLYPKSLRLQLIFNRVFRHDAGRRYLHLLPNMPPDSSSPIVKAIETQVRRMNPLREGSRPPMKPETERFLQQFFAKENRGLASLIGKSLRDVWPYMHA